MVASAKSLFKDVKFDLKILCAIICLVCPLIQSALKEDLPAPVMMYVGMSGFASILIVNIVLTVLEVPDKYSDFWFMGVGGVVNIAGGIIQCGFYKKGHTMGTVDTSFGDDVTLVTPIIGVCAILVGVMMLAITFFHVKSLEDIVANESTKCEEVLIVLPYVCFLFALVAVTTLLFTEGVGLSHQWEQHIYHALVPTMLLIIGVICAYFVFAGEPNTLLLKTYLGLAIAMGLVSGVLILVRGGDNRYYGVGPIIVAVLLFISIVVKFMLYYG